MFGTFFFAPPGIKASSGCSCHVCITVARPLSSSSSGISSIVVVVAAAAAATALVELPETVRVKEKVLNCVLTVELGWWCILRTLRVSLMNGGKVIWLHLSSRFSCGSSRTGVTRSCSLFFVTWLYFCWNLRVRTDTGKSWNLKFKFFRPGNANWSGRIGCRY